MTSPEVCGLTLLGPDFAKLDVMLPEPLCTPSLGLALRGEGCLPSPGLRWTPRTGKDDPFLLGARCGAAESRPSLTCRQRPQPPGPKFDCPATRPCAGPAACLPFANWYLPCTLARPLQRQAVRPAPGLGHTGRPLPAHRAALLPGPARAAARKLHDAHHAQQLPASQRKPHADRAGGGADARQPAGRGARACDGAAAAASAQQVSGTMPAVPKLGGRCWGLWPVSDLCAARTLLSRLHTASSCAIPSRSLTHPTPTTTHPPFTHPPHPHPPLPEPSPFPPPRTFLPCLCSSLAMTMVPASSSVPVSAPAPASSGPMGSCRSVPSRQARARSPTKAEARRLSVHSAAAAGAGGAAGSKAPGAAAAQAEAQPLPAEASSGGSGGGGSGEGESMEHRLTLDFLEEHGYFDMPIQVGPGGVRLELLLWD